MDGIQQTADWIHTMLAGFQADLPDAILELLQSGQLFGWIELTATALREPREMSYLAAISTELMNPDWPAPLAPATLEKLLLNLRAAASTMPETADDGPATATEKPAEASNPLHWDADIHPELLEAYMQETPGQISEAARLIHLIAKGSSSHEQKRHAARLAHTAKGASGVVGVMPIVEFTHRLEDILELDINPHLADGLGETLSAAADCLETLFEHLQENKSLPAEYAPLLAEMDTWEQRLQSQSALPTETTPSTEDEVSKLLPEAPLNLPDFIRQTDQEEEPTIAQEEVTDTNRNPSAYLNVPMETIQTLLNLAGELITSTSQIAEHAQHTLKVGKQLQQQDERVRQMLDELGEAIDQQAAGHPLQTSTSDFDQLELEAYNDLHSASGLLTESIADNREIARNIQQQLRHIADQVYQQQRLQRQLSETILRTRLVPVQSIVARAERTVRETCRRTGKQARVNILGQTLQIDTDTLQNLTAPLLHLLRNAVDHGIESPDARQAAGKRKEGHIQLNFEQKGNQIHMTLSDDGQGMDLERIRSRALERGLIQPEKILSDAEVYRLILLPGFTTRDQISDISGRGVGMDVVQSAVENLQGTLHLHSDPGQGSSINIQVPLTLIATHALLVRTGGNLVAIPSITIQQILHVTSNEYILENGQWRISYQGKQIAVLPLTQVLGWQSDLPDLQKNYSLLIVESENKAYALHVDEVLQPRDIVIKSLSPWLNLSQGISGACILADGAVAPVLDTLRLLRNLEQGQIQPKALTPNAEQITTAQPHILVVDDSLINRKSLNLMLEQMGYKIITAVDGLDALQQLHKQSVELILTDLEMPRMNGLEMTQAIRIWPEKRHLPILMITSRSTQKHREMAQKAGVDEYLTKPVDRDTLSTQLQKWLGLRLGSVDVLRAV
jgi:chemosensory pili system protein ChpA (sensor histidine kinase/response regulator)